MQKPDSQEDWTAYFPVRISMFGELTFQAGSANISHQLNSSRKMSSLLAYLLLHAGQSISVQELLEAIWPESERDDPVNALKTLVYRARLMMKADGIPFYRECILAKNGTYRWNPEIPCEIDVVRFETGAKEALASTGEDRREKLAAALRLYKGEFLPHCALDEWVMPLGTYYHSLYLRVALAQIALLQDRKDFQGVVDLAREALTHEPLDEELNYSLIQALANLSKTQEALEHYEYVTDQFFRKLGMTPSDKIRGLYQKIVDSEKHTETDLTMIKKDLDEPGSTEGAFVCEYGMFKQIYRLESRVAARNGVSMYVVLLTVRDTANGPLELTPLNTAMNQLLIITQSCLRKNDVIARFSSSQYVLMLPSQSVDSGRIAVERIISAFQRRHPHSPAVIHYTIQPLDPTANM